MDSPLDRIGPRTRLALMLAALTGVFLSALDGTITATAMPRIVAKLGGTGGLTWVVTAYLLASTVTIPLYGRFSDLYGRRPALLTGLGVFLGGSALCGTAGSMGELIGFRTVQGLGAGALMAVGMTLIRDLYPPERSTGLIRMQSLMATMLVVSFLGGPLAGGLLTDHAGWRWVFWVNLPFGLAAMGVLIARLPGYRPAAQSGGRLDVSGIVLLSAGTSALLVGLARVGEGGTGGWAWAGAGVLVLAGFIVVERRAAVPVLPLRLFASRTYSAVTGAGFLFSVGMFPVGLFVGLYFQQVRGYAATTAGLLVFPLMIGMIASNRLTAAVAIRTGRVRTVLAAGAIALAAGAAPFLLLGPATPVPVVVGCTALMGLGIGPSMGGVAIVAQSAVPRTDIGAATAALMLLKQLGGMVGLACGQTLFVALLPAGAKATAHAIGVPVGIVGVLGGGLAFLAVLAMRDVTLPLPGTTAQPDKAPAEVAS